MTALALRASDPARYQAESFRTMQAHVRAMNALQARGADTFDYGNNLRGHAHQSGMPRDEAFAFEGFWCDRFVHHWYGWRGGARTLLLVAGLAVGLREAVESHSGHDDAGDGVFVFGLCVCGDCGFWVGFDWDSGEALHAAEG